MDAHRDLTDLNCHILVIEDCQNLDHETCALGLSLSLKRAVLFCTYTSLVSLVKRHKLGGNAR